MSQHYTRNTVSASKYCNTCKRVTQHSVHDRRIGHCLEHGGEFKGELEKFEALPVDEQIRAERIAIMVIDGGLSEQEAIEIIDQKQQSLFPTQATNDGGGWSFGGW